MNQDLTERELDDVLAMLQDHALWHSHRILPLVPYLVAEIRRRRGTVGPTMDRDRRNTYPRSNQSNNRNINYRR